MSDIEHTTYPEPIASAPPESGAHPRAHTGSSIGATDYRDNPSSAGRDTQAETVGPMIDREINWYDDPTESQDGNVMADPRTERT